VGATSPFDPQSGLRRFHRAKGEITDCGSGFSEFGF